MDKKLPSQIILISTLIAILLTNFYAKIALAKNPKSKSSENNKEFQPPTGGAPEGRGDGGASARFICGLRGGVPTTLALTPRGAVPVIQWTSQYFNSSGYSPERRCQIVSQKFEKYYQNGTLKFLTIGKVNGLPVICVADTKGGPCTENLFTIRPGSDPNLALRRMLNVRARASGPLNESSDRIYLDFNKFLETATVDNSSPSPVHKTDPSPPALKRPGEAIW